MHTYASMPREARKSIRWVADQLGHSNPELALRVYGHGIRSREEDLSFADFGPRNSPGRPYTAPLSKPPSATSECAELSSLNDKGELEHETGLEPATTTLATWFGLELSPRFSMISVSYAVGPLG